MENFKCVNFTMSELTSVSFAVFHFVVLTSISMDNRLIILKLLELSGVFSIKLLYSGVHLSDSNL